MQSPVDMGLVNAVLDEVVSLTVTDWGAGQSGGTRVTQADARFNRKHLRDIRPSR